jgi:hypothetical protein
MNIEELPFERYRAWIDAGIRRCRQILKNTDLRALKN